MIIGPLDYEIPDEATHAAVVFELIALEEKSAQVAIRILVNNKIAYEQIGRLYVGWGGLADIALVELPIVTLQKRFSNVSETDR